MNAMSGMSNTPLKSAKAKEEMLKALSVGKSKAKSANVPYKKQQALSKTAKKAAEANAKWERPNLFALCRKLSGGDVFAATLLFHILYVWRNRKKKLQRHNKAWLAHTRIAWAHAAGITESEMNKRALPRLRKYAGEFLVIRAMGNGSDKKTWVHVDEIGLKEAIDSSKMFPWDEFQKALNGVGPGNEKKPANHYQKDI